MDGMSGNGDSMRNGHGVRVVSGLVSSRSLSLLRPTGATLFDGALRLLRSVPSLHGYDAFKLVAFTVGAKAKPLA